MSCIGSVPDGQLIDTASVGDHTFTVTATDAAGNTRTETRIYRVVFAFSGFHQPVDNPPVLNTLNAGRAVPVKFNLGGNHGLMIFMSGYPATTQIDCALGTALAEVEQTTTTAGANSLSYDPAADQYVYTWNTESAWAGTCRRLTVKLADGTTHTANFKLR